MVYRVNISEDLQDIAHQYVVIAAITTKGWIWVRHKERSSWEMPGGHVEPNESVIDAAKRELFEETGALTFNLTALFDYSVETDIAKSTGRVFIAQEITLGPLPESEIAEIFFSLNLPENLTYPFIQPKLFEKAVNLATQKGLI
jgi:8-oxo-dGTP diphosphatase